MYEISKIIKLGDKLTSVLKVEKYEGIHSFPPLIGNVFTSMANFIIDYEGFHKNQILKTELEEYKEEINGAIDKAKDKVDVDMANGKYTGARLENYQEISDIFKEMKCFINNSLSYDLDGMEPEQDFDPMRTNRSVTFTQVNAAAEVGDSNDDGLYVKESPARPKST